MYAWQHGVDLLSGSCLSVIHRCIGGIGVWVVMLCNQVTECPEDDSCLIFDSLWQQQSFGNYP